MWLASADRATDARARCDIRARIGTSSPRCAQYGRMARSSTFNGFKRSSRDLGAAGYDLRYGWDSSTQEPRPARASPAACTHPLEASSSVLRPRYSEESSAV
jgi:hypothetical protein